MFLQKERVCEDSASTELSVTEIASAMSEIDYILDQMKSMPDSDSPFSEIDFDSDEKGGNANDPNKMPANLEELKEVLGNRKF